MSPTNKVIAWWDVTDPADAGWYAQVHGPTGEVTDDSVKVWFAVNLDAFERADAVGVRAALERAYPTHAVEVRP